MLIEQGKTPLVCENQDGDLIEIEKKKEELKMEMEKKRFEMEIEIEKKRF